MAAKRLWSSLAESTKKRYKRNGVTPQMYNSPRKRAENKDLFAKARGHAPESYAVQRARMFGLDQAIHNFSKLPKKSQQMLADSYMGGLMQKNEPLRQTANGGFEFAPPAFDQGGIGEGTGQRISAFDETIMNRFEFMRIKDELLGLGEITPEDWKTFRALYNNHF